MTLSASSVASDICHFTAGYMFLMSLVLKSTCSSADNLLARMRSSAAENYMQIECYHARIHQLQITWLG